MAFKTKFVLMLVLVLLFLVVVQESSGCHAGHGCFYSKPTSSSLEIRSRKVLLVYERGVQGPTIATNSGVLRTAPSGPDPLHHNGATPKKPTTP